MAAAIDIETANNSGSGFDVPNDDPRHTANRSGLASDSGNRDENPTSKNATPGPPGVGSVEGSQSGVGAPRVEMTDIGLVDLNSADMSVPSAADDDGTLGARVKNAQGNVL